MPLAASLPAPLSPARGSALRARGTTATAACIASLGAPQAARAAACSPSLLPTRKPSSSLLRRRSPPIGVRRPPASPKAPQQRKPPHRRASSVAAAASKKSDASAADLPEGASADIRVIAARAWKLAKPYWTDPETGGSARWKLATVVGLTLGTTGVSVLFNFLGRDFFNALSEKDTARFAQMLVKWLGAIGAGVPVFVLRDYLQSRLALDWRQELTKKLTADYLGGRAFYRVAAQGTVDNPDQRIAADVGQFTDAALGLFLTLLAALVDLVSFSGILYSIYPPLFAALIVYSLGGTAVSLYLGKKLVPLNFKQEAAEADLRYALVRLRENAEAVAFYGGEAREAATLEQRLAAAVANGLDLLATSRNLAFFTSMYRYVIQILPAAVVAPLYFKGAIELGVINQSASAFNHVLSDVSLVVYQLESLAGLSAVIDRLGEFSEAVEDAGGAGAEAAGGGIELVSVPLASSGGGGNGNGSGAAKSQQPLLEMRDLTLWPPFSRDRPGARPLVSGLSFSVAPGDSLLIVGPSGAGKTSILRAAAGLWTTGRGQIARAGEAVAAGRGGGDVFFVPQKPYVVLGTLRDQLLYPSWVASPEGEEKKDGKEKEKAKRKNEGGEGEESAASPPPLPPQLRRPRPSDAELAAVLRKVNLGSLLDRGADTSGRVSGSGLDATADWSSMLSLGEQQRLAIARVLLARPRLVLMDESTSALDVGNEAGAYDCLKEAGVAVVSVGHRPSLTRFHSRVLRLKPAAEGQGGNAESPASDWELADLPKEEGASAAEEEGAEAFAGSSGR